MEIETCKGRLVVPDNRPRFYFRNKELFRNLKKLGLFGNLKKNDVTTNDPLNEEYSGEYKPPHTFIEVASQWVLPLDNIPPCLIKGYSKL